MIDRHTELQLLRIAVPDNPSDGDVIIYWTWSDGLEGLVQNRLTYVENKTHLEVTGDKGGRDWVKQWRSEYRYVPGMSNEVTPWQTAGRNDTDALREFFAAIGERDAVFATFESARDYGVRVAQSMQKRASDLIARANALGKKMYNLEEPPP